MFKKNHRLLSNLVKRRAIYLTKTLLLSALSGSKTALDIFVDKSMLPFAPVLASFLFFGVHPDLDINAILWVKLMHMISLKICMVLKQCLFKWPLGNVFSFGNGKPFSVIRRSVLSQINLFLKGAKSGSTGYGLKIDFSNGESVNRLSGLHTETRSVGTLEATNFDSFDKL